MNWWKISLLGLIISASLFSQSLQSYKVKYISADYVYLDAGSGEGLLIGDSLTIRRGDSLIANLEIAYVAEHSASCKILESTGTIRGGDLAILMKKTAPDSLQSQLPVADTQLAVISAPPPAKPTPKSSMARVDGSVSFQLMYWDDRGAANLDFNQPTARLNLRVTKILGKAISFIVKSRARRDQRAKSYSPDVPKDQWRNRIYELALRYDDPLAKFNFQLGRIISNKFSGVGYIDGLLVQNNISEKSHLGAFAGTQPQWQSSNFQMSIQKYGAFYNYTRGDYQNTRIDFTAAMAGEYHSSTVSREFIYIQNNVTKGDRWAGFGSAEIDINRGWRKDKTNQALVLSNLYLTGNYRILNWLKANVSLDNRKNYWTYETRNIADTLFDNALRQGIRTSLDFQLPRSYNIYAGFGINKRKTDTDATYSYSVGVNKNNFLVQKLFLNGQAAGFTNMFSEGYNLSTRLGRYFGRGNYLSIGYGNYFYQIKTGGDNRLNQWLSLACQLELAYSFYLSNQYEYDFGDDLKGNRILAEVGYRF